MLGGSVYLIFWEIEMGFEFNLDFKFWFVGFLFS